MSMLYAIRQIGDVTILDLNGRITLGEVLAFGADTVAALHELVRDVARKHSKKILLNLADVTSVDTSGLGELVSCMVSVRNLGGELKIFGATKQASDLLRMTRLSSVLDAEPNEAAALRSFEPKRGTTAA